jgi:hypothetical protein
MTSFFPLQQYQLSSSLGFYNYSFYYLLSSSFLYVVRFLVNAGLAESLWMVARKGGHWGRIRENRTLIVSKVSNLVI